ncbi:MAG: aminotransferase class V-fold PLP-dependent enzyme [Agrobacterium sp.]|nr:aminotransferase class V-fold PLP-dependent enzyme [Agrobacterium sp.]
MQAAPHVTFTSGATEAANLVLDTGLQHGAARRSSSAIFIVSAIEHPRCSAKAVGLPAEHVTAIPRDIGRSSIDLAALERVERRMTRQRSADGCRACWPTTRPASSSRWRKSARLIVPARGHCWWSMRSQAAGRMPLDIEALDADFLILSSHKLGGPKGAGALVSRGEVMMPKPLIHGGGQEKGHRSGTENTPADRRFRRGAPSSAAPNVEAALLGVGGTARTAWKTACAAIAPDVIIHGDGVAPRRPTPRFSPCPV